MHCPLNRLAEGVAGRIVRFTREDVAGKMVMMGILPGSEVRIVRIAPFKGGYYLKIDGMSMAVRQQEAGSIVLEIGNGEG